MSVDQIILRGRQNRALLKVTKDAFELWHCAIDKNLPLKEYEDIISNTAVLEWGQYTHCTFDRATKTITIEHFDGRHQILSVANN